MGTIASQESIDLASQYTGIILLFIYKATMGTQAIEFIDEPSYKIALNDQLDYIVGASAPTGTVTMTVSKLSATQWQYVVVAKGSEGAISGSITSTTTVTISGTNISMKTKLVGKDDLTGITTLPSLMTTTPASQPASSAMVFKQTNAFYGKAVTLTWTLDSAALDKPTWECSIDGVVAGSSSQGTTTTPSLTSALTVGAVQNRLGIYALTDTYGANLRQVVVALFTSDPTVYPGGYPKDLIAGLRGKLVVDDTVQPFLHNVNQRSVLKGCGDYDIERAAELRDKYKIKDSVATFYSNLNDYFAIRYGLSGLLFKSWSEQWLLRDYFDQFLSLLRASPFAEFVSLFLPGGIYYGYEDFYRTSVVV